jgi:hypothetical protein
VEVPALWHVTGKHLDFLERIPSSARIFKQTMKDLQTKIETAR